MPSKQTSSYQHKLAVQRLHRDLIDGTPCDWCNRGLFRHAAMNWDGRVLQADHVTPRSHGNAGAPSRLLHATCNNTRGPGRDHLKPATSDVEHEPDLGVRLMRWPW